MALMLAIWSAQPNWMPRKPKLMFQICQKLKGGRGPSPAISRSPRSLLGGLLDQQDLPLVRAERQRQPPTGAQLAVRFLREEVGDRPAPRRGLDRHGLPDSRPAEVDRGDLGARAGGQAVDHDDKATGLHRRQRELLALVDAVPRAHPQHLAELGGERVRALELLGKRAIEGLGTRQVA